MNWQPATLDDVKEILRTDLIDCDALQTDAYNKYAVEPYLAPIKRYGSIESVVVVARHKDQVMYYEDIEEGFNISPLGPDGDILEHWCNQDSLGFALNRWIMVSDCLQHAGPAEPLDPEDQPANKHR